MNEILQLLVSFGKIGVFALGGGNSMIKLMEDVCVAQRGWLTIDEYSALVGASYLFPGLTVIKVSGLVGMKVAGIPGLVVSVLGITAPGMILAALFYTMIIANRTNPIIQKVLVLMQYGAVALLAAALVGLMKPLSKDFSLSAAILAFGLFIAVAAFDVSPFFSIFAFVLVGIFVL